MAKKTIKKADATNVVMGNALPPKELHQQKLASGDINGSFAIAPFHNKYAQFAQSPDTIVTNPQFFSPINTNINWQIAARRREVYMWSRYFFLNEPKVFAGIKWYSDFCINGFKLVWPHPQASRKMLRHFEYEVERLEIMNKLKQISLEYHMIGDVFIHVDMSCEKCGGTSIDPDSGERCNHKNGDINKLVILNPDWIEVVKPPWADEAVIVMIPDEDIIKIVQTKQPAEIYNQLSDQVKQQILQKKPIRLSPRTLVHMKHMAVDYGVYGTSMIRPLFQTLAYKTKLMSAQWLVAERLIVPIKLVKVGSDQRPAGPADIAEAQQMLASIANEPNVCLVTHHLVDIDFVGAQGKILQVSQELEHIDKELLDGLMLNQALLNGEATSYNCHSEDTLTLTDSGFKQYTEIDENDKIACVNPETKSIEYHPYIQKHIYDYNGEMVQFKTEKIDILVTPNHRMYVQPRNQIGFRFVEAKDVKPRAKVIGVVDDFVGEYVPEVKISDNLTIPINEYCELAGFYVSEGSLSNKKRKNRKNETITVNIHQSPNGKARKQIVAVCDRVFSAYHTNTLNDTIHIYKPALAQHFELYYGRHSYVKRLPAWIKNLPVEQLKLLLHSMILGDGSVKTCGKEQKDYLAYHTSSEQLSMDVAEIGFKCGYVVTLTKKPFKESADKVYKNKRGVEYHTRHQQWVVYLSKGRKGVNPGIESRDSSRSELKNNGVISRVAYTGKVYCFTVPHGLFVTMRNGLIAVQGNSAQVGVETLIRRLENFQTMLSNFVIKRVFEPIAQMKGFIDKEKSKEYGRPIYYTPEIKWNDLRLRDRTQRLQQIMQLHDKQVCSTQTLCEEMELNYSQEVERTRYEMAVAGPQGAQLGGGGGGPGGMPGGGMAGGGPAAAGGPGAAPEMGGPGGMPGGDAGGGAPGGGGGAPGGGGAMASAGMPGSPMKVIKKSKAKSLQKEVEPVRYGQVRFTELEQSYRQILDNVVNGLGVNTPYFFQYPVQNPRGGPAYKLDFAFPKLKLDFEVDGQFHQIPEQLQHDKQRDYDLAMRGWTVIRFDSQTVEDAPDAVKNVTASYIKKLANSGNSKKASGECIYKTSYGGNLIDLYNDELPDDIFEYFKDE